MPHGLPPGLEFAHPDQVSDLEWLLLEIGRIKGCEATKAKFVALLKAQAGRRIYFSHKCLTRPEQVAMALRLLNQGEAAPVVRDRLVATFGLSVRHAYTTIEQALNQRGKQRQAAMKALQADMFHQPTAETTHAHA